MVLGFHSAFPGLCMTGTVSPVIQERPLRLSDMKNFVQGHTTKYQGQGSTSGVAGCRPQQEGLFFPLSHITSNIKSKTRPNVGQSHSGCKAEIGQYYCLEHPESAPSSVCALAILQHWLRPYRRQGLGSRVSGQCGEGMVLGATHGWGSGRSSGVWGVGEKKQPNTNANL